MSLTKPLDDLRDITSRLAQREQDLLQFWNYSNDILVILSKGLDGVVRIERISPSAEEILGWTPEEVQSQHPEIVLPENTRGCRTTWSTKSGMGLPPTQELCWTTSPWFSTVKGDRCFAVARPIEEKPPETPRPISRRWTPMTPPSGDSASNGVKRQS